MRFKTLGLEGSVGKGVTSPDRRAEANQQRDRAVADGKDLQRRIDEQFGAELEAIKRRYEKDEADRWAYKFRIYRRERSFSVEVAKGDTWEEAFAQLDHAPATALKG